MKHLNISGGLQWVPECRWPEWTMRQIENWVARSFELGWSESSTDAALTFRRQSPLDTVTKTSTGPHLPLAAISLWLIKLSTPMNKAPCPPQPSTPGVDGRKDDPNVDALSFNIDWIGPPAPGLNANEFARPFLTAAVRGVEGWVLIKFLQWWMWDSLQDKWALSTVGHPGDRVPPLTCC